LAARRGDADSIASNSVGSTVALSFSANGLSASGVACWFTEAPSIEQVGAYVQLTATLVDANQALTVAKKSLEKSSAADDALLPSLGTVALGGVTITLTEPMETLDDLPSLERTAGGFAYINGPLRASAVRQITGTVANEAAYTTLRNWVASTVQSTPSTGDWWPTSPPTGQRGGPHCRWSQDQPLDREPDGWSRSDGARRSRSDPLQLGAGHLWQCQG